MAWQNLKRRETSDWLKYNISLHFYVFICSYHVRFGLQTQVSVPSPRITGYLHKSLSRATALCICMHDRSRGLCVAHVYTMHTWSWWATSVCKVMYNNYRSIGVQTWARWLILWCACVRHGIYAHSLIESIPDGIKFCCGLYMYTIQSVWQIKATCCPVGTE